MTTEAPSLPAADAEINQWLDWRPDAALAAKPTVTPAQQRQAMRRHASAVAIITAEHQGARAGLTATAVCSVTADPPRLVVFVNRNVRACNLIVDSGALCVNLLGQAHQEVAQAFAGAIDGVVGDARFAYGQWTRAVTGSPVLEGALVNFDCRVVKVFDESTHLAFLCEVLDVRNGAVDDALLYADGGFKSLPLAV